METHAESKQLPIALRSLSEIIYCLVAYCTSEEIRWSGYTPEKNTSYGAIEPGIFEHI